MVRVVEGEPERSVPVGLKKEDDKKEEKKEKVMVRLYDPHPGFAGAAIPLPANMKDLADRLDGQIMTLDDALEKIRSVAKAYEDAEVKAVEKYGFIEFEFASKGNFELPGGLRAKRVIHGFKLICYEPVVEEQTEHKSGLIKFSWSPSEFLPLRGSMKKLADELNGKVMTLEEALKKIRSRPEVTEAKADAKSRHIKMTYATNFGPHSMNIGEITIYTPGPAEVHTFIGYEPVQGGK